MNHCFLTVLNRRWCMCCNYWQQKKPDCPFVEPMSECPNNVPKAKENRDIYGKERSCPER